MSRIKTWWEQIKPRKNLQKISPLKIIVGASQSKQSGWVATQQFELNLLQPEQWQKRLGSQQADAILAEHVWEHLTPEQGLLAARTCYQFLKPNGRLRVAVPDGNSPHADYINYVKPGGTGPGSDDHKVLFTHDTFQDLFTKAGFQVTLLEYFDEHGQFKQQHWSSEDGHISRSAAHDTRNQNGQLNYTSIILDAIKV